MNSRESPAIRCSGNQTGECIRPKLITEGVFLGGRGYKGTAVWRTKRFWGGTARFELRHWMRSFCWISRELMAEEHMNFKQERQRAERGY